MPHLITGPEPIEAHSFPPWRNIPPPWLLTSEARSFERKHGAGVIDFVRSVFEQPTGGSAGAEGRLLLQLTVIALSQFLLIDSGSDFGSLSALDYDPVPPRRKITVHVDVVNRGRPPALAIE